MASYFGRQYRIEFFDSSGQSLKVIDSRNEAHPLQIIFSIETSFGGALSMMELTVVNLSFASIGILAQAKSVSLQAGYPVAFGPIFYGDISNMQNPREGVERLTTFYCWSGYAQRRTKTCEVSFDSGAAYSDIVEHVATDMFNAPPEYIGFSQAFKDSMGQASDGYNANQPHSVLLDNLGKDLNFQWLVDNGKCLLMERGASRGGEQHLINYKTGLVGGVSLTFLGADFETKLNPNITIGDRVKVESESTTINFSSIYFVSLPKEKITIGAGEFTVKAIRRSGNFYGDNSWSTFYTCWRDGEKGLEKDGLRYG